MFVGKAVTGLLLTAAGFLLITGTASAEEDPLVRVNSPVDQNVLRVENNPNGAAVGSPGVISGNVIQVPIHLPINLCGNSIDIVGLLNPTFGNTCVNA